MSIKVKAVDIRALRFSMPALMRDVANEVLTRQRVRITDGRGTQGQMRKYSPGYAKEKAASGRQTGVRDLTWSGDMLAGRKVKEVTATTARIGWDAGSGQALKALGNEERTPFVKPTKEEKAAAIARYKVLLKKEIDQQMARIRAAKR